MNFSEIYGEVDIGVKATTPDDYAHLPVDSYVDREELEQVQEDFWEKYVEQHRTRRRIEAVQAFGRLPTANRWRVAGEISKRMGFSGDEVDPDDVGEFGWTHERRQDFWSSYLEVIA